MILGDCRDFSNLDAHNLWMLQGPLLDKCIGESWLLLTVQSLFRDGLSCASCKFSAASTRRSDSALPVSSEAKDALLPGFIVSAGRR